LNEKLYSSGFETFGEDQRGEAFVSEEEAEAYVEEIANNFDLSDYIYGIGTENFMNSLSYAGIYPESFIAELAQNLVFPLWLNYWQAMGIEGTRESVEEAYNMLKKEGDISNEIMAINHALNVTHQSGDMIDYLEQHLMGVDVNSIKSLLDDLSSNTYIPEWNKELKEIGVKIPVSVSK